MVYMTVEKYAEHRYKLQGTNPSDPPFELQVTDHGFILCCDSGWIIDASLLTQLKHFRIRDFAKSKDSKFYLQAVRDSCQETGIVCSIKSTLNTETCQSCGQQVPIKENTDWLKQLPKG